MPSLTRREFVRANAAALACLRLSRTAFAARLGRGPAPGDVPALLAATDFVRNLPEAELAGLVPVQSGLHFVGCANCHHGAQEDQLAWLPARPAEVFCRYCGQRYPTPKYPLDGAVRARTPRGGTAVYPYWENAAGYRYFFPARRDDAVREYLADAANSLGLLYAATKDRAHARRAALIVDRFAQVFPGWCYHYDYPFRQKRIYDGAVPPSEFLPGYRTARWTWWGYLDVPLPLVYAYAAVRGSGVLGELAREQGIDVAARIENDLFRSATDEVMANPEPYTNMSPTAWFSFIVVGRTIGEPRYIDEAMRRLRTFASTQFFYDGAWHESASYALQTVFGLDHVLGAVRGPLGSNRPEPSAELAPEHEAILKQWLPDGRLVPIGDTWTMKPPGGVDRWAAMTPGGKVPAGPAYLLPAFGRACVESGEGPARTQFHLTWSGGYGHQHADNQSLLLYAHGRELLSDIGYTHTAYRGWATSTAAHNTVVIDGRNQAMGSRTSPSDGSLLRFDARDPRVQVIATEGTRAYAGLATTYGRTLVVVDAGAGRRYALDLFRVQGGRTHDYFLHGDADRPTTVGADLELAPLRDLLPRGARWKAPRNEAEGERLADRPYYAYGFLSRLQSAPIPAGAPVQIRFTPTGGPGPGARVTLLPDAPGQLVAGYNPSVRQAHEDDAQLENFLRPFLVLRQRPGHGASTFVGLLEPYEDAPFIASAERLSTSGPIVLRIALTDGGAQVIVIGAAVPLTLPLPGGSATFQGDVGVLFLQGANIEHAYALGKGGWNCGGFRRESPGPVTAEVTALASDTFTLAGRSGSPLPAPSCGSVIRVLTADGWVYPYTVAAAKAAPDGGLRIRVAEGPGLVFDPSGRRLRLTTFPQREHVGPVQVAWDGPA